MFTYERAPATPSWLLHKTFSLLIYILSEQVGGDRYRFLVPEALTSVSLSLSWCSSLSKVAYEDIEFS